MIFTRIRLLGLETIELNVNGAKPSDTYLFKGADGLGPPESSVRNLKQVRQGRSVPNRQVVIRIGLNPNFKLFQSASELRDNIYGLLTTGNDDLPIPVQFLNGENIVAVAYGDASKVEPSLFTETPEVQVTIDCDSPYLRYPVEKILTPPLKTSFSILNEGTAATGFSLSIAFTGTVNNFQLTRGTQKMLLSAANFIAGDTLLLNTIPGQKDISKIRAGVESSLLHTLSPDSTWFTLYGGLNTFTTNSQAFNWNTNPIRHTPLYWGV